METLTQTGLVPVESSDVAAVGYQEGTLTVRLRNGGVYRYTDLPEAVYSGLLEAEGKGRYLHHVDDAVDHLRADVGLAERGDGLRFSTTGELSP